MLHGYTVYYGILGFVEHPARQASGKNEQGVFDSVRTPVLETQQGSYSG